MVFSTQCMLCHALLAALSLSAFVKSTVSLDLSWNNFPVTLVMPISGMANHLCSKPEDINTDTKAYMAWDEVLGQQSNLLQHEQSICTGSTPCIDTCICKNTQCKVCCLYRCAHMCKCFVNTSASCTSETKRLHFDHIILDKRSRDAGIVHCPVGVR